MIRASGAASVDGHTVTMRPCESNAIEPHSDGTFVSELVWRLLPSGPERRYWSVIHVSLWMLLFGFGAMNGFWGAFVDGFTFFAVAAEPWNAGSDGSGGVETIGTADAAEGVIRASASAAASRYGSDRLIDIL